MAEPYIVRQNFVMEWLYAGPRQIAAALPAPMVRDCKFGVLKVSSFVPVHVRAFGIGYKEKPSGAVVAIDENTEQTQLKQRGRMEKARGMSRPQGYLVGRLEVPTSAVAIASRSTTEGLDTRHIEGIWLEGQSTSEEGLEGNFILQIGDILGKPSSGVSPLTMLAFGAGVSTMYHLNHEDRFQDKILAVGMILGFLGGTLVGHDEEALVLHVLGCAILLALSVSAIGHRISRSMKIKLKTHESDLLA